MFSRFVGVALVASLFTSGCVFSAPPAADPVVLLDGPQYPLFDQSLTETDAGLVIIGGAGGDMGDGLLVDEPLVWNGDRFDSIPSPPGPPRNRHGAVWANDELIIWSGSSDAFGIGSGLLTSGAAYDPATGQWRSLADVPRDLAKVFPDSAVVEQTVLFGGGLTERSDNNSKIAAYDLGTDEWREIVAPGAVVAIAGDGSGAFALWIRSGGPQSDDAVASYEHGIGRIDTNLAEVRSIDLPEAFGASGRDASLFMAGDRLVLFEADKSDGSADLFTSRLAAGDLQEWNHVHLDDLPVSTNRISPRLTAVWPVGDHIAIAGLHELSWVEMETGRLVQESLDPVHSCALGAAAAPIDGQLVAIGGNCTTSVDGVQQQIYGSFVFTPPD